MKWQPIETAPKSGTVIDLWNLAGFRYPNAAWDITHYGSGPDDIYGWTDSNSHGWLDVKTPFTHWMPRPAPPETTPANPDAMG